jgi:hypothetical protein
MISFYIDNLIDKATLTPSSVNAQFPANNLKDSRRTKVFRTNNFSDNLVIDFQETSSVDSFIIMDNWKDGFGVSTLSLQLNPVDNWATPLFQTPITYSIKHGISINEFTPVSGRFARLVMSSTLDYCELSKIFIGKKLTIGNDRSINFGWTYVDNDLSSKASNRYGQLFFDKNTRQKQFNISFSLLTKDAMDDIFQIYDKMGETKPFYVSIGCDNMNNEKERFQGMVYMNSIPTITNTNFNRYSLSMSLIEAK